MTNQPRERRSSGIGGVLGVCVAAGVTYLVIGIVTDQVGFGVFGLLIMLAYGAVIAIGHRRVEVLALLGGDFTDERQRDINQRALAFTANVLVAVILCGFLYTLATKSDLALVFAGLAAVGGAAFLAGVVWHSTRG